ncbi:hypothetical protein FALBO_197 [Fusarium albosuccineum]|uniref:Uncharacterized protein n=1 Tax=Fusarium albosuccineum TaxID=1237068 RepID=A0A8H4PHB1_9HYPO|nr:hypothetical protein FALBO_197 [Fusarium albosuccineum]
MASCMLVTTRGITIEITYRARRLPVVAHGRSHGVALSHNHASVRRRWTDNAETIHLTPYANMNPDDLSGVETEIVNIKNEFPIRGALVNGPPIEDEAVIQYIYPGSRVVDGGLTYSVY